jgi:hypothetical protein
VPPLDRWLPEFDVHERHERRLPVSPSRALEIVLAMPAATDPAVRVLLWLRGIRSTSSIGELGNRLGFEELARTPTSLVSGGSGTPWRPRGGSRPFADPAPGTLRMAIAFWAEPLGAGGSLLLTETRVAAVDERARRAFRRYWRLIGPFSALIRRRWLAAAAKRAAAG